MKTKFPRMRLLTAAVTLTFLGGCLMGPNYVRPPAPATPAFKEAGDWKPAQPNDGVSRGNWWEIFGDAKLNALADQVNLSNENVRSAEARLRQAEALVEQSRSGLWPTLALSAGVTRSRSPIVVGASGNSPVPTNLYNLPLTASWAPDLWGSVRRTIEGNVANAQTSAANLANARLLAQSQVAINYFQLRVLDARKRLLDDSVAAYSKSMEVTRNRYNAGVAARVELVQAETQLKSTQAQSIDIGVQRAQVEHAMAILIGKPPAELSVAPEAVALAIPAIPAGMPSQLLERRPDIAAAERQMAASNAQIGVAQAAYFPSLTITATNGFRANSPPDWLTAPSRYWSLGATLAETIFDGGSRKAVSKQAQAAYDANVSTYRQTVLTAFQQVEDNLAALRILEQEALVQAEAVQAARQSTELTLNQYKAGTVNYLNVVIVQTAQLNNEATAVNLLGQRLVAAVTLVQALGGGWDATQLSSVK
ncbi:MAG: efflux transporter outer rane subunit [Betaproteobacteria bacterium]|nr:efflux transporter outer rane subunit [Betaproteobacteria bacterium]